MNQLEPLYIVDGNIKWHGCCGKQYFLKKIKIELSYDPAILCLGIYPEKVTIQKDTCTPVFTAALFTMTKTWKQSNHPTTEE